MNDEQKQCFVQYYEKYYTQALLYTMKKVQNRAEAEDIVMNAFFACYKKFEEYNSKKASFPTWFYFVLNNKIKNYYRDHKENESLDDIDFSETGFEEQIVAAMDLQEKREQLATALLSLNETQRKIIILKYFKNKNASEIARTLGINPGNVRVQLMRGINKLREFLEKNNFDWEN